MITKLGRYKNGNYTVTIFSDGTKVRLTKENEFKPAFSENCDVKITDKCSVGCPFCYEGCTASGSHADLLSPAVLNMIESLHPYTEFAINGNDMDHPQLMRFLTLLRAKKVVTNITVNQSQFIDNYQYIKDLQDNGLIYGIGVSYNKSDLNCIAAAKNLKNVVFHTIAGVTTPDMYVELVNSRAKILVLGYKNLQRGVTFKESNAESIEKNIEWIKNNFDALVEHAAVVSFDNLALDQIDVKSHLTEEEWDRFYMGDDGEFTFYIDLVKMQFSQNSVAEERYPIENKNIDEMFNHIQSKRNGTDNE